MIIEEGLYMFQMFTFTKLHTNLIPVIVSQEYNDSTYYGKILYLSWLTYDLANHVLIKYISKMPNLMTNQN